MPIPQHVTASEALARSANYAGTLSPAKLPRLAAVLKGEADELQVELSFHKENGRWLQGVIRGSLPLLCETCQQSFVWSLDQAVELRLVFSEAEEERWIAECEPCLVQDDRIPLQEVVEDEVLLALPMFPRCPACEQAEPELSEEVEAETPRPNPFAALLKH